jgi:hypothetical protein
MPENFNSLDPLGPQYGGNAAIPTTQNNLPFEGDILRDPKLVTPAINKPQIQTNSKPQIKSFVPGRQQLTNRAYTIKRNNTGSPDHQEPLGKSKNVSRKQAFLAMADKFGSQGGSTDKNRYGKTIAYNAGPTGQSYMKRYQALGQEKFDQIGFTPFRDNENVFNNGTTWSDKTSRMITHAAWPLFSQGLSDNYKSLNKMMHGDFSADTDQSRRYQAASAIGYDSSPGFGSFFNNTAMSFSYTAGIMASAILEETAGALLAPLTGGASFFAATANNLKKVPLIGKGLKAVDIASDTGKAINRTLYGLKDINKTRQLFKSVGNFLNPLDNLTDAAKAIYKNEDNFTGLARVYYASQKTAGGLYRDIRALNFALSEARLEGGFVEDELYRDLYDEQYRKTGGPPNDLQQEMLVDQSKKAGETAKNWNTALIYLTNKVVFPNLINPKGGIKNFLKGATDDIMTFKTGKIVFNKAKKAATDSVGKILNKGEFEYVENSFVNTMKGLVKSPLRKSIPGLFTYFKANVMEGLQENAQDVISEATKKYYKATYDSPAAGTYMYARGLVEEGIKGQFSAKGFETFASGLLMGAFAAPINASMKYGSIGYNMIFDKAGYKEYYESRKKIADNVANHLNNVNPKDFFNSKLFNYANQVDASKSKLTDTEKLERDKQEAAFQTHLNYVLETDSMNAFTEHIESFKQMSSEEFEEAFGLEPGTGAERQSKIINRVVSKAKNMQKRHNQYKERFTNPIDYKKYRVDSPEYKEAEIYHEAWESARRNAVFFNESFEDVSYRMKNIIDSVSDIGSLKNVSNSDVNVLFDRSRLANEIGMLKTDIEILTQTGSTADTKSLIEDKKNKLKALESFQETFTKHYNYFNRKELVEQIKAVNPNITEEELNQAIEEKYGPSNNNEALKLTNELRKEFGNYLNALGNKGTRLFDSDIDQAFEKFLDFYELDKESRTLVDYINLLHDPEGYIEHVNRNAKWMKDLYNNRKEYYKEMVEKALIAKENNDLLNYLANMNIYISEEALINWVEKGTFPEEFYDDTNNTVITASNPQYQDVIQVFIKLAAIQNKETGFTEETVDDTLKEELNALDKQKGIDLNNLVKSMTREDKGVIEPVKGKKFFSMATILEQSVPGDYIEALYDTDENSITYYNDQGVLKYDNIEGDLVEENEDIQFTSAVKYTNIMKADPAEVKTIVDKYAALRAEAIENYRKKPTTGSTQEKIKPLTVESSLEDIKDRSPELHNSILSAFNTYFETLPSVVTENITEDQKQNILNEFIRTSLVVKELLYQYNKKTDIKSAEEDIEDVEDFGFMLNGARVNTADYKSLPQLRNLINDLELLIDSANKVSRPSLENINKIAELKAIKNKIESIIKTRAQSGYSEEMKNAIRQIEELQKLQKNIIYDGAYVINNKILERVTKAIQRFIPDKYKYKYENKVIAAFKKSVAEFMKNNPDVAEPNEAMIDNFINELNLVKKSGDGISTDTLKNIKQDLLNFIKRGYVSSEGTNELIQNGLVTVTETKDIDGVIKQYTFEFENGKVIDANQSVLAKNEKNNSFEIIDSKKIETENVEVLYNRLKKDNKNNYVFATSLESVDKMSALENEVKLSILERTYEEATKAGDYIDKSIKELFSGVDPVFDPASITQEAFDQLFGKTGYLAKLKEMVDTGQYYVVSEGLRVYDEEAGIAGEIDLLLVDQTGKFIIIDVKTGKEDKWLGYNDKSSYHYNKKIENTYQQAAYARLLKNMFPDIDATTSILPIQITYNEDSGVITSVSRPSDKKALKPGEKRLLSPGKFILTLDKNSVKEDIDKLIPEKVTTMNVGKELSPATKSKLYALGFSNNMIELMSDEDIESAKTATEKSDVKDLITKYELLSEQNSTEDDVEFTTDVKNDIKNTYTISISDIESELSGINDPVSFTKYKAQLNLKLQQKKIDPANVTAILELLKNKESVLLNTNDVKVSETLLKVGDKLIVKNTIFKSVNSSFKSALTGNPEVFASEGVELIVSSIKNNKVMFKYQGSQRTINMSDINDYFTTLDIVEFNEKNVVSVDNASIATAVDSSTITEQFLSTANAKELEDEYKNISATDALDNLESERDENCKK